MKKQFVLFDFDGVIADSFQVAFKVQKMICPRLTENEYRKRFEGNINDWEDPKNFHHGECRHSINFFEEYVPKMKEEVSVFSGMKSAVDDLSNRYTLIVISSTITIPIKEFLEKYDMTECFSWIMGNDVHKRKTEKINMVCEKYGARKSDCVFVTDTLGDLREASSFGVGAIGVAWGFQSTETLAHGNPFRIVGAPRDLALAIAEYFSH